MWKKILSVLALICGGFFWYLLQKYVKLQVEKNEQKINEEKKALEGNYQKAVLEEDEKIAMEFEKNRHKPVTKLSDLNISRPNND